MSATAGGARSKTTASASGSSASDFTVTPVSIFPPYSASAPASAVVIEAEPPFATAQPNAWQAQIRAVPTDELIGRPRLPIACAATPPKRALACGVLKLRCRTLAGAAAASPKRTRRIGWLGTWSTGRNMSSFSASKLAAEDPKMRRHAAPSTPRPSTVSLMDCTITPAVPSSSGWARSTSGHAHSSPWRSRPSELRNGDPTAIGCTAEQWSWSTPGTVSSPVRVPPADGLGGLEHGDLHPLSGERDRAREPVGARADDDGGAHSFSTGKSKLSSSHGWRTTMSATATEPDAISPVAAS